MTDNRAPEVDPRYDPAFQRHGSTAPAPAARTRWADPVGVRAERLARVQPAEVVSAEAMSTQAMSTQAMIGAPPDGIEPLGLLAEDEQDPVLEPGEPGAARRWELAILITAIALIGGGVALGTFAVRLSFNGYAVTGNEIPIEYLLGQFGYQLAPPLITVGVAALVGLLFLRAAAARGRR